MGRSLHWLTRSRIWQMYLVPQAGVMPVTAHDVGRFDEGPLVVLVGRLSHIAGMHLAPGGVDGTDKASAAGQPAFSVEAIDRAVVPLDDTSSDVSPLGGDFDTQIDEVSGMCSVILSTS